MRAMLLAGLMAASALALAGPVQAQATDTIIVTPGANANTAGTNNVNAPFGANGGASTTSYVMQVQYAASMFSGIALGSEITSIGVRLSVGSTTNATALNYTNFSILIGSATNSVSALSSTYAANEAANTITARSGSLTIAKHALLADACTRRCSGKATTNSFYTIDLDTPFIYNGGDIVFTFDAVQAADTVGKVVPLDAIDPWVVAGVGTVESAGSSLPTRGTNGNFSYAPILQLTFAPPAVQAAVPEPASWALMLGGFGLVGGAMRRRRLVAA